MSDRTRAEIVAEFAALSNPAPDTLVHNALIIAERAVVQRAAEAANRAAYWRTEAERERAGQGGDS